MTDKIKALHAEAVQKGVCVTNYSSFKAGYLAAQKEDAAEIEESDAVRDRLATLLSETAVALKGEEEALTRHSWHDLPVIALEKMIFIEQQSALIEQLAQALSVGWSPYYVNGIDARKLSDEALAAVEEWRNK